MHVARHFSPLVLSLLFGCAQAADNYAAQGTPAAASAPTPALHIPPGVDAKLYALGVLLSEKLQDFDFSESEMNSVRTGFGEGLRHPADALAARAYIPQIQDLQQARAQAVAAREASLGHAYLDKVAKLPHAVKTTSGLVYVPLVPGNGASPTANDRVKVNYTGRLIDGTVFDASERQGQPVVFGVSGVIPCWTEALQRMKVGGKSRVVCPAEIAYGDRGAPPDIKPGATLDFEVELLEIAHADAPIYPTPAHSGNVTH